MFALFPCLGLLALPALLLLQGPTGTSAQIGCYPQQVHQSLEGELASHDGFSRGEPYGDNMRCRYEIRVPDGYFVHITFDQLSLELSEKCQFDVVRVYGQHHSRMDSRHPEGSVLRFCGEQIPPAFTVDDNIVLVEFVSDQGFSGKGFHLQYRAVSRGRVKSPITSLPSQCGVAPAIQLDKRDLSESVSEPIMTRFRISPQRVMGGSPARVGEFPWLVSLTVANAHGCGASIISSQWLLSAAHCFAALSEPEMWEATPGELELYTPSFFQHKRALERIVIHPRFRGDVDENSFNYDVALLKLREPLTFTDKIQPICLPTEESLGDPQGAVRNGVDITACYVAGWGKSKYRNVEPVQQKVMVPVLDMGYCNTTQAYYGTLTNNMLCAGYREGVRDSCSGDSGGPLMCPLRGGLGPIRWLQMGIVSYGNNCSERDAPGIYTNVVNMVDWIEFVISH